MRLRSTVAAACAVVLAGGCTGGPVHPPGHAPPAAPGATAVASAAAPVVLPRIVLTAELDEPPARWTLVATIPFGPRRSQLDYVPAHEIPTVEPPSFAAAPDGTLWILDPGKHRLAHYSATGRFLGDVVASFTSLSRDLAFMGRDLWAILDGQGGRLLRLEADGRTTVADVRSRGRGVFLIDLIPTVSGLLSQIGGFTPTAASPGPDGPIGLYRLALGQAPRIVASRGLPLPDGRAIWAESTGPVDLDVHMLTPQGDRVQPVHVRIVEGRGGGGRVLEGAAGPGSFVLEGQDLLMYVRIVAHRGGNEGAVGRRYLLRIGSSPLLWERLPDPTQDDDRQYRWLAGGPQGGVFLMKTDVNAVRIYRR